MGWISRRPVKCEALSSTAHGSQIKLALSQGVPQQGRGWAAKSAALLLIMATSHLHTTSQEKTLPGTIRAKAMTTTTTTTKTTTTAAAAVNTLATATATAAFWASTKIITTTRQGGASGGQARPEQRAERCEGKRESGLCVSWRLRGAGCGQLTLCLSADLVF